MTKTVSGRTGGRPTPVDVQYSRERAEFSDAISEDEQGEEAPRNEPRIRDDNKQSTVESDRGIATEPSTRQGTRQRISQSNRSGARSGRPARAALSTNEREIEEIVQPKARTGEQKTTFRWRDVFTPVFLCQLMIVVICVVLTNYIQATFFTNHVHVSDTNYDFNGQFNRISQTREDAIVVKVSEALPGLVKKEGEKIKHDLTDPIRTYEIDKKIERVILEKIETHVDPKINNVKEKYLEIESKLKEAATTSIQKTETYIQKWEPQIKELITTMSHFKTKHIEAEGNITVLSGHSKMTRFRLRGLEDKYVLSLSAAKLDLASKLGNLRLDVENVRRLTTDTMERYTNYTDKLERLEYINSTLKEIQRNVFNKDKFTLAFMILVGAVLVLAMSVFNLYQRVSGNNGRADGHQHSDSNGILRQIPAGKNLEPGVCIISFDESRTPEHRRILDSAGIPNCEVQTFVIRRHEQIPVLPSRKVYLMCTEFSERHVIIEEPGKGLGDLHRTTYNAVQKLGGCLIILYTKDPGSRQLHKDSLYNTNIYCVTHQKELSDLNDDGRFLSFYDNLTHHQKAHLRKKIVQNMT